MTRNYKIMVALYLIFCSVNIWVLRNDWITVAQYEIVVLVAALICGVLLYSGVTDV